MNPLTIGFVRRGFSRSGGAESYLKRLASGILDAGHRAILITTDEWPENEWPSGELKRLNGGSPRAFADRLEAARPRVGCDLLMSLERVWSCDVYRAGDGVHASWLARRALFSRRLANVLRRWNSKHRDLLRLEEALLREGRARMVIANSEMVRNEIVRIYGFPAERIDVIYNGVPVDAFDKARLQRNRARAELDLAPGEIAILFAGSGWERKGLRFAIEAVELLPSEFRLFVAGRGDESRFASSRVRFLGETADMKTLFAAADLFLLPTIYDPFSNACLEALAAGLPVITTRANGFSEIIENGVHGSVVDDPADVAAFAAALRDWRDQDRRNDAIARNMERASHFDITTNVARTLAVLMHLAAQL